MKKFYAFFLLFIVAITVARAQRTIDLNLLPTKYWLQSPPGSLQTVTPYTQILHDGKTGYAFVLHFENLGPDSIMKNDTIFIKFGWGYTGKLYYSQDTGLTAGEKMGILPFNNGTSANFFTFSPPPGMPIPFTDTINWCDSVGIIAGPGNPAIIEPDLTNNRRCNFIKRSSAWEVGINDVALNEDNLTLYPNPTTESVTIKFDARATGSATITLRDMMGKTVYSLSLNDVSGPVTQSVDVGHLPPGMYTAELRHNNQTLIRKLTIQ